jgi:hypothetical protein
MVDPTLPDQVQTQAAGGPSREDRAGPVEPLQEASDPVRSEPYMSSPPKREDIDARLDRIASLLETIITHEKHEGPAKTSRIPKAPMFSDREGSHESKISRDEGETKTMMSSEEAVQLLPPVSERISHAIPTPPFLYKDPFVAIRRWDSWHKQVTDPFYKNACGTHAAIQTLLESESNRSTIASGPASLQRFEKAVLSDLLLGHTPTPRRDEKLWQRFVDLFRTSLEVTNEQEEKHLFQQLFRKVRQPGESIYGFALEYKLAASNFNRVSLATLTEHNWVHFMIMALHLQGYPMLELRLTLVKTEERGGTMSDVLEVISKFPDVATLT